MQQVTAEGREKEERKGKVTTKGVVGFNCQYSMCVQYLVCL